MLNAEALYQDAERVHTTDEEGERTWVVLAEGSVEGVDLVLAADEGELLGPDEDMHVAVFRVLEAGPPRRVEGLEDPELEERAFDYFFELMGLEGA